MKITRTELKEIIRDILHEELYSNETIDKKKKASQVFQIILSRFEETPGWERVDITQEDEYSMNIKYALDDDTYIWRGLFGRYKYTKEIESIIELCKALKLSFDLKENDSNFDNSYDVTVYLRYEG